ncbi:MAG: hypothetical protein JEY94_15765 [Melioribacteraceae bacterium]|nr:hypothetical protein [Melioribacteraceae bacterium]
MYLSGMKSKVISIVLISLFSILLWGYISLSGEYRTTITPEVRVSNVPENYDIAGISSSDITIRVKGQGWDLAKLVWGPDFNYDISAKNDSGRHEIFLRDELDRNSRLPSTIQVIEMLPERINFKVDKVNSKLVPIFPNILPGYRVGYGVVSDIKIVPDSILISGTKNELTKINSISTILKEFEDLDKSVSEYLELEQIDNINYSLDKTLLQFEVEKIIDLTFEDVPVETRGVPYFQYLQLYPSTVDVILRGGINKLSKLEKESITAYINYKQAIDDSLGAIQPRIIYPTFTSLVRTEPNKLEYIIKKKN